MLHFRLFITVFALVSLCVLAGETAARGQGNLFHAIAYHNIVDDRSKMASDDMTLETLVNHFEWLLANDYHPVSIDQLIAARKGQEELPERAVLLCWDDGYSSFFTHVFPLLRAYRFPAVLALVGDWLDAEGEELVLYGDNYVPRSRFLTKEQLVTLAQSPLIEIASHSFGLHKGLLADGAGDVLPAAVTHEYDPLYGTYETDSKMYQRVVADLKQNNEKIRSITDTSPRVMVWPFGRYSHLTVEAAAAAGLPVTLTLDPVAADASNLSIVPRIYPTMNAETGSFKGYFRERNRPPLRRFVKVPASSLLEKKQNEESVFSIFLERVKRLGLGRVYFEPVVVKGEAMRALFRNTVLPVAQDRLIRLSWHTNRRAGTEVHMEMSAKLFDTVPYDKRDAFFYEMGKSAPCSGLLLSYTRFTEELLQEGSVQAGETSLPVWNPNMSRHKRQSLLEVSSKTEVASVLSALEKFQYWQPFLDVGLMVSFEEVSSLTAEEAQWLLGYFDYIMVDLGDLPPSSEEIFNLKTTLGEFWPYFTFMLPYEQDTTDQQIIDRMVSLQNGGIVDYGYAYDFFEEGKPALEAVSPHISGRTYPFIPK